MNIKKYVRICLNILLPILTILLICTLGPKLLMFFIPFVIGWIVAMIANPPVRFLEKRVRIVRKHGSAVLIIGVLALVIAGLYWGLSKLFHEIRGFAVSLPALYETFQGELTVAYDGMRRFFDFLPADLVSAFDSLAESLGDYVGTLVQNTAAAAGGAVARTLPEVFVNVIFVLISAYLFLAEHDRILTFLREKTPDSVKRYTGFLKKDIRTVIGGYFLAQFKIMFVVAVVLFIGFLVLQVRYSLLLAVGIAILDFLPMFGTGTALIPWAVIKFFTGEYVYAIGLILLYLLTQAMRQVIQPKIVGDSMGLSPLTTLFLLFMGFKVKGIAGMILAVPIGMIFIKFYEYGAFDSMIENMKLLFQEIRGFLDGKD